MTSPTQQLKDPLDVEKFSDLEPVIAVTAHPDNQFDVASIDLVQRRLKQRHVQMYVFFLSLATSYLHLSPFQDCGRPHYLPLPLCS